MMPEAGHVRLPDGYVLDVVSREGLMALRRRDGSSTFRVAEAREATEVDQERGTDGPRA